MEVYAKVAASFVVKTVIIHVWNVSVVAVAVTVMRGLLVVRLLSPLPALFLSMLSGECLRMSGATVAVDGVVHEGVSSQRD